MSVSLILMILAAVMLVGVIIALVVMRLKGYRETPNFRSLFIIGIAIMVVGIPSTNYPLMVLGLIYMIVGIVNRKKWKDAPRWSELSPQQRKFKIIVVVILAVMVALGVVTYVLMR